MLSGKQGISQVFLEHWYVCGGHMDISEVVVFMIVAIYILEQVSLAYPVKNLSARVELCCV